MIDRTIDLEKTVFYLEVQTLEHNDTYYVGIQVEIIKAPIKDPFVFNFPTIKPLPEDPFFNDTLIKKMTIDLDNLN